MTRLFLLCLLPFAAMAESTPVAGVADAGSTIGSRRLQASFGSVHNIYIDVMRPKRMLGWKPRLARHIQALLNSNENGVIEVKIGDDEHECPGPTGAVRAMSEQANRVWLSCEVPMVTAPVEIQANTDSLTAVQQVLDILSEDEALGEDSLMFLSTPRVSLAHKHGLSYAEWKRRSKKQFDGHVALIVIGHVALMLLVLLVVVWLLMKLVTRSRLSVAEMPARSPWRKAVMPFTFAASLLTGTVAAPMAAGMFWHLWKNDADESREIPTSDEMELNGGVEAAAEFEDTQMS